MSRWIGRSRSWTLASLLVALVAAGSGGAAASGTATAATLYLEVVLNGTVQPGLAAFELRDGHLWADAQTLRGLRFRTDAGTDAAWVDVNGLPGVNVDYDASRQRVALDVPLRLLDLAPAVLGAPAESVPAATASTGVLLNYDLYASAARGGARALSGYGELRAFSAGGTWSHSGIVQGSDPGRHWRHESVRFDSVWSKALPERMLALNVGDTLTRGPDWARPTYIGGIQLTRDFSLQPYRLTMPLPSFYGEAAAPSAIELYVDGMRQYGGQLTAGPFQLNAAPTVSGAGLAQIVLTDALGRVTTFDFPFYATPLLLQRGLVDFSIEAGFVRRERGQTSFDYAGDPMASGLYRYGLSDRLTVEAHAETREGTAVAGGGFHLLLGMAGVLSASQAHGRHEGRAGSLTSLGYVLRERRFQFGVQGTVTDGAYRDVASAFGRPPPRASARALLGVDGGASGNFGLVYAHLRYPDESASRYASLSWSRSIAGTAALNLNLNRNLDDAADRSVFVGFTMSLGRAQLGTSLQHERGADTLSVDATRPIPGDGGVGWRVQARGGETGGGIAEIGWRGPWAQVLAGVQALDETRYAYTSMGGALVWIAGHTFATRRVDDAFAVVSTAGMADVPVLLENRPIGRTDEDGVLLVTPLNAYQRNRIGISPLNLPADVRIDDVERSVVPMRGTGTHVGFALENRRGLSLALVDAAGEPLPAGSRIRRAGGTDGVVGYDGQVYLEDVEADVLLEVDLPSGRCRVRVVRPEPPASSITEPLTCR